MAKKGYIFNQSKEDKTKANILITDDISKWWAYGLREMSNDITNSGASHIMVQLCTDGGDVFEGNAIASFIKGYPADIDTSVLGLCASIGTVIAVSGRKTSISKGSRFMIHNATAGLRGEAKDLRKTADFLDEIDEEITNTYVSAIKKNGKLINNSIEETKAQVQKWQNEETWFSAEQAVEYGFIQELTEGVEFLNKANAKKIYNSCSKYKNVPTEFLNKVKSFTNMAKDDKGLIDKIKALVMGESHEEPPAPTVEKVEPTEADKKAAFEAYCKENGLQVQPTAKVEPPKVEDKTAEMEAKIATLEADKKAADKKAQKLQEQIDGASSAGKPNLRKAETDSPTTDEQKKIENLLITHGLVDDFNELAAAINLQ